MARELELQRLAARQHGLASRQQLLRLGYTRHDIEGRSRRDLWPRVAPQVYDVAPASFDPLRQLQAAVLATRGVGSHRSAAVLLGTLDIAVDLPEVLVAEGRSSRDVEAVVRRTRTLTRQECTTVEGIACTNATRTLLDLGAATDPATLEIALNRAVTLGLTTVRKMLYVVDTVPLAGRPGAGPLREVLEHYRRDSAVTASLLETIVERAVRAGRIPPPARQYAVRVGSSRYRLDFGWPEARVLLEADGLADHHGRRAFENDRVRQNRLVIAGWYPLRYTWAVAKHRPTHIADELHHSWRRGSGLRAEPAAGGRNARSCSEKPASGGLNARSCAQGPLREARSHGGRVRFQVRMGRMDEHVGKVLIDEETLRTRVIELGEAISRDYAGRAPLLVGVLKGALVFVSDLARAIDLPTEFDFMAVSSYGNATKTSGVVRIVKDLDLDLTDRHVIIVEDIVDSGLTLSYLRRYLQARKPASLEVCALLVRDARDVTVLDLKYIGFTIADEFVIGYGLDVAERYRNLPFIADYLP